MQFFLSSIVLELLKISDRRNFQSNEGIKRCFLKSVKKLRDIPLRVLRNLGNTSLSVLRIHETLRSEYLCFVIVRAFENVFRKGSRMPDLKDI